MRMPPPIPLPLARRLTVLGGMAFTLAFGLMVMIEFVHGQFALAAIFTFSTWVFGNFWHFHWHYDTLMRRWSSRPGYAAACTL